MNDLVPRQDVGSGGLAGALTVVFMLLLDRNTPFDFNLLVGALTVLATFGGGYLPQRMKSVWTAVMAFVSFLVATLVGVLFYGFQFDSFAVSAALAGLVTAYFTYRGNPASPDGPEMVAGIPPQTTDVGTPPPHAPPGH